MAAGRSEPNVGGGGGANCCLGDNSNDLMFTKAVPSKMLVRTACECSALGRGTLLALFNVASPPSLVMQGWAGAPPLVRQARPFSF